MVCAADIKQKGLRQLRLLTHHVDNWGMTVLRWRGRWRHTSDDDDTWWWLYCVVDETMTTRGHEQHGRERHVRDVCTAEFPKHVVDDCTANDDGTRGLWLYRVDKDDTWSMTVLQITIRGPRKTGTWLYCKCWRRDTWLMLITRTTARGQWLYWPECPPKHVGKNDTYLQWCRRGRRERRKWRKFGLKGTRNSAKVRPTKVR